VTSPHLASTRIAEGVSGITEGRRGSRTDREEAAEHAAIPAAFEAGDAPTAATLVRDHIATARTHLPHVLPTA